MLGTNEPPLFDHMMFFSKLLLLSQKNSLLGGERNNTTVFDPQSTAFAKANTNHATWMYLRLSCRL